MIPLRALFLAELRRCLSRRAVRLLVLLALVMIAITAGVAFVQTEPADMLRADPHIARLADLWHPDGDSVLSIAFVFLAIGALIGGAVVVGGEWKAGTVTTTLLWESRRSRLLAMRLAACAALSVVIGLALLALLVAATLPTVLVKGETGEIDAAWAADLAGAVARGLGLAAFAATCGGALASLTRSTAGALSAMFVYQAIGEPILRGLWPRRAGWFIGENAVTFVAGHQLDDVPFGRSAYGASVVLTLYVLALGLAAAALFARRDLAGTS